jgi:molybdenum cofactor cytidylyltransferase
MNLPILHPTTAIIILAGGESRRLGRPKQTLSYKGDFLINHAIRAALGTKPAFCIVVLGANAEAIRPILIPSQSLAIINCEDWKSGMGASIQCGMSQLPDDLEQVVLMLGDQPFVDSVLLTNILEKAALTESQLICCAYGDDIGVPALFGKKYFHHLRNIEGKGGAKKILKKHYKDLITLPFEQGIVDVDTVKDYHALLREDWRYFESKQINQPGD